MKSHDETEDYNINKPLENGGQIGICEVIGKRSNQEDAVCYDAGLSSLHYSKLDDAEKNNVMTATFVSFQMEFNTPKLQDKGSCACVATGWIDHNKVNLSTSYVGDSVSYMLVLDKDNNVKYCAASNPALHDLQNPEELAAIRNGQDRAQQNIEEGQKRVGGLAVTRALGDTDYDGLGVSHKPETTSLSYPHEATDKVFMIVVCDGAMEHLKGADVAQRFAEQLGSVVSRQLAANQNSSAADIAKCVEQNATAQGSADNISVMVVPLQKGLSPVTAAVFDGHNGNGVSKILGSDFNQRFQQILEMTPEQRVKVIDEFDAAFKQNIEKGNAVNEQPISTQAKRGMLMKKGGAIPKLDIPVAAPAPESPAPAAVAESPKEPVITPRTLLTELWLALQSSPKLDSPLKSIKGRLDDYMNNKRQLDDPENISHVTESVMNIIERKQTHGHMFARNGNATLASIENLMKTIQSNNPDLKAQQQLMDKIVEQVSPRKGLFDKKG